MVSVSVLVRPHMCKHLKKGGKSRPLGCSRQFWGQTGPTLLDNSLSLAQKAPHLTPLSPGAWWTEPHQGTPLPGPGQGSRALSLSLSSHHKHWWLLTSWEASFPAEERTWQSGLCSHPCRDGPTHTKTLMLFTSRPDHWPFIHFASWNVLLCSLLLSLLGQSKCKSKV